MDRMEGLNKDVISEGVICRLCLKIHELSIGIFVSDSVHGIAIWNLLQDLLNLQVAEGDGLPDTACHSCVSKLVEFSEFKEMCLKSSKELQKGAPVSVLQVRVKEEVDPGGSLPEVDTGWLENHCGGESEGRTMYGVSSEELEIRNEAGFKEEFGSNEMAMFNRTERDENSAENGSQLNAALIGQSAPCEVINKVCVQKGVDADDNEMLMEAGEYFDGNESLICVIEEVYGGIDSFETPTIEKSLSERFAGNWSLSNSASSDMYGAPEIINAIEEDNVLNESHSKNGFQREESHGEDDYEETDITNVAPKPLEVEHQVSDSHLTKGITQTKNKIGICVRAESHKSCLAIDVKKCKILDTVSAGKFLKNNPTGRSMIRLCQLNDDMCTIEAEIVHTKNFGIGPSQSNSCQNYGNRNERMFESGGKESRAMCVCKYCGISISDESILLAHLREHFPLKSESNCAAVNEDVYLKPLSLMSMNIPETLKSMDSKIHDKLTHYEGNLPVRPVLEGNLKQFNCETCGKHSRMHCKMCHEVPFKCFTCGEEFSQEQHLWRPMAAHPEFRPYKCDKCEMDFLREYDLEVHTVPNSDLCLCRCSVCKRWFSSYSDLSNHIALHRHEAPLESCRAVRPHPKSYPCKTCGKLFREKDVLDGPLTRHLRIKPNECDVCLKKFFREIYRRRQMRNRTHKNPYLRDECGKGFFFQYRLRSNSHLHSDSNPFKCGICGKQFVDGRALASHSIMHSDVKSFHHETSGLRCATIGGLRNHSIKYLGRKHYTCKENGVKFYRQQEFSKHVHEHNDKKLFKRKKQFAATNNVHKCITGRTGLKSSYKREACGKTFGAENGLKVHSKINGDLKWHLCKKCGRKFSSAHELGKHIDQIHYHNKPYKCAECGKGYPTKESLGNHILSYVGLKLLECKKCGRKFHKKCDLGKHLSMHDRIQPLKCDICGEEYSQKIYLAEHIAIH
ncbi:zinc finger protein 99-like [Ischnura elegans]|uniref:zinc finger protein 99-like n=1 Tax=Ischnura elegans TaxID=197161 RepID=UPI001ED88E0D|nr:zinc finger protein 99-like [Ischnura elegans]